MTRQQFETEDCCLMVECAELQEELRQWTNERSKLKRMWFLWAGVTICAIGISLLVRFL